MRDCIPCAGSPDAKLRGGWRERRDDVGDFGMHIVPFSGRNPTGSGIFGDPEARVIRLNRRSKKLVCGCCGRSPEGLSIIGFAGCAICRAATRGFFLELEVRRARLSQLRQGGSAERLDFLADNPRLHQALCLYVGPALSICDDQGRCHGGQDRSEASMASSTSGSAQKRAGAFALR